MSTLHELRWPGELARLARVERRVAQVHARHGSRVALVGHSHGGHYARARPADKHLLQGDGVVAWPGAVVDNAECVDVSGSHVGLIYNRSVYRALAQALAEPELNPDREEDR